MANKPKPTKPIIKLPKPVPQDDDGGGDLVGPHPKDPPKK